MKIVFATNTTWQANEVLNEVGADVRLLSYWYLRGRPDYLAEYVKNGLGPPRRQPKGQPHGAKKARRILLP